ncbi:MAG TPA: acetate--CoA ligase family protein [Xanthobacteraceae bacterium]|nr:acetate--CoA ligase family protein [Xanthobacteraceae bacterium]
MLAPRSVAIIGASDDPTKSAARPLQYLRRSGYRGRIYPINPHRDWVLGERAWRTLTDLPERPDHAYVLTGSDAAVAAVEECGRIGIPVATVLADGFAPTNPKGAARAARLREACVRHGIRVVGPSCLGVVNLRERLMLTANAAFAEAGLPIGGAFVASQSGSVIGALASRGKERGIGFAGLVSVGSEIDLSIGEICAATLDDPDIDGYLLFLENLRHAETLRRFARGAAERGKPVAAYKLGRSAEARELALSHTGALAGEDDVADAFLRECGIARVETFEGLLEALPLLKRVPIDEPGQRRDRVGVVTTTGGVAAMVVDQLAVRSVSVVGPGPETLARLAAAGAAVEPGRIVDLTLAGTRYPVMKAALDTMLTAPEFDLVVAVVGSSARFQPELAVEPVIDSAKSAKPIAAFLAPDAPDALNRLMRGGVPSFRTPEACADVIAAALRRRRPRERSAAARPLPAGRHMLDELKAYGLLDAVGVARAPTVALPAEAREPPLLPFPYPVAVKALSGKLAHKSDVGGVVLGVPDGAGLLSAVAMIRENLARQGLVVEKVLIQPMVRGLGEALIGYRVDAEVGPLVVLAAGGLLTEIYRDRTLRFAPVDREAAREMIGEVRALRALSGLRGQAAGDLDALAEAIVRFSHFADMPEIIEAESNPVIVREAGRGVVAVDAVAVAAVLANS